MTEQEIDALALEAERAEAAEPAESDVWIGESGATYSYDPREGYELGDPKRNGPGGYW